MRLSRHLRRSAVVAALAVALLITAVPVTAKPKSASTSTPGTVHHHPYGTIGEITFDYLVYTPAGWKASDRLPVYVMVHGCGTTAAQQMAANLLNPIADRERFIVAYPDNGGQCWRAVSDDALLSTGTGGPNSTRGTGGDADIIADMTKQVTATYNGDADRVYMIGMSSGAFQVASTATAYPELYAAVGVSAGGGPGMAVTCIGHTQASVPLYAQKAVAAMGERARVIPFFTIGGTRDPLGEQPGVGGCARLNYLEWLFINNTLAPSKTAVGAPGISSQLPPRVAAAANTSQRKDTFETDPYSTKEGTVPNGYRWTSYVARDPAGCEVGQRWVVHGMGHYWSGGTTDPTYSGEQPTGPGFNDPKGPSASQLSWDFFKQFTLSQGNVACQRG